MTQMNTRLGIRLAWWAKPLSYVIAYAIWRFVGEKRALFYAGKAMCLGLKITSTVDSAPSDTGKLHTPG